MNTDTRPDLTDAEMALHMEELASLPPIPESELPPFELAVQTEDDIGSELTVH